MPLKTKKQSFKQYKIQYINLANEYKLRTIIARDMYQAVSGVKDLNHMVGVKRGAL